MQRIPSPAPINDYVDFREIANWIQSVCKLARYLASHPQCELKALIPAFDEWREDAFASMAAFSEIRQEQTRSGRKLRYTLHMHEFVELSRLHWMIQQQRHKREYDIIATLQPQYLTLKDYETMFCLDFTKQPMWVAIRSTFIHATVSEEEETETDEAARILIAKLTDMWKRPILQYSVSQVHVLIIFLTQYFSASSEYLLVYRLLWKRIAELLIFTQDAETMDVEDMRMAVSNDTFCHNRDFLAFCSAYMIEIDRRVFFGDLFGEMTQMLAPPPEAVQKVFDWISHEVELMSEDTFETTIQATLDESYYFPGDELWFKWKYPNNVYNRGACINQLRPHLSERYFSQKYLSKSAMLKEAYTQHPARLFVLHAVEQMLQRYNPDLKWLDGIKIDSDAIEYQDWKFQGDYFEAPLLVQPMYNYWVYFEKQTFATENIYQTITLWFLILRAQCNCQLFKYDLTESINQIFGDNSQPQQQEEQREGLLI